MALDMNETDAEGCPDPWGDPKTAAFLTQFGFWFGGVLFCCIGCLGLIGNMITIAIFRKKNMASTFHVFLTILAWADLGYLLVCVLDESLRLNVVALTDPHVPPRLSWVYIYPKFLFPLQQIFMSCSIYMTVVICINRYMCIVYPLKFTPHCPPCESYKAVDSRRITISTSCVVIGSILYSIPHFMEYQVVHEEGKPAYVGWTDLRRSHAYSTIYTITIDFIVRVTIPVVVTATTSSKIFCILRKTRCIGKRDRQFAVTMFFIVLLFLFCQSGKIVVNVHNFMIHDTLARCNEINPHLGAPAWDIIMTDVARVLLLLNSSLNVVIYCFTCSCFWIQIKTCAFLKCQSKDEAHIRGIPSLTTRNNHHLFDANTLETLCYM